MAHSTHDDVPFKKPPFQPYQRPVKNPPKWWPTANGCRARPAIEDGRAPGCQHSSEVPPHDFLGAWRRWHPLRRPATPFRLQRVGSWWPPYRIHSPIGVPSLRSRLLNGVGPEYPMHAGKRQRPSERTILAWWARTSYWRVCNAVARLRDGRTAAGPALRGPSVGQAAALKRYFRKTAWRFLRPSRQTTSTECKLHARWSGSEAAGFDTPVLPGRGSTEVPPRIGWFNLVASSPHYCGDCRVFGSKICFGPATFSAETPQCGRMGPSHGGSTGKEVLGWSN